MRFFVFVAGLLLFSGPIAHARDCEDDSIEDVSSDGAILKMLSNHVYEVDASDAVDSSLWLTADDVLVCEEGGGAVLIVNTDEDGEKVAATRLK